MINKLKLRYYINRIRRWSFGYDHDPHKVHLYRMKRDNLLKLMDTNSLQ